MGRMMHSFFLKTTNRKRNKNDNATMANCRLGILIDMKCWVDTHFQNHHKGTLSILLRDWNNWYGSFTPICFSYDSWLLGYFLIQPLFWSAMHIRYLASFVKLWLATIFEYQFSFHTLECSNFIIKHILVFFRELF